MDLKIIIKINKNVTPRNVKGILYRYECVLGFNAIYNNDQRVLGEKS